MVWWFVHCCFGVGKEFVGCPKRVSVGCLLHTIRGKAKVMAESLSRKTAVELRVMFAKLSISKEGG